MSRQQPQPQNEVNEIAAWYKDIPICTKFLFTSFLLIPVLGKTFIDPYNLVHVPFYTFYKLQVC